MYYFLENSLYVARSADSQTALCDDATDTKIRNIRKC